jgi:hypothetical protein
MHPQNRTELSEQNRKVELTLPVTYFNKEQFEFYIENRLIKKKCN